VKEEKSEDNKESKKIEINNDDKEAKKTEVVSE